MDLQNGKVNLMNKLLDNYERTLIKPKSTKSKTNSFKSKSFDVRLT